MPNTDTQPEPTVIVKAPTGRKISMSVSTFIIVLLLILAGGMFWAWNPWNGSYAGAGTDNSQTTSVTGEAKVTAEPDEFVFYPTYEFKNADKATALAELTKKSEEVTAKLKELGVADNKIKTNSSGHNYSFYYDSSAKTNNYNLQFTITTTDKDLTQKVQDYLITTAPTGNVSPQANFSDGKRKELENKARDEATKDARAKAEQSAKNLGFKLGKVKSVEDGAGFGGGIEPYDGTRLEFSTNDSASSSLKVQPGENDLTYTVTVAYYIR